MSEIKTAIENRILVMYLKHKFNVKNRQAAKNVSWIKRQHLNKIVKEHCNALMSALLNDGKRFSFGEKKFIINRILNSAFEKGLSHLKSNSQINMIKPMLHLNSYVIYEEFAKGVEAKRSKKNIKFNINKELTIINEEVTKKASAEVVLEELIGV